ncbi:response regulator [Aeromicrobium sp. YIM 150415]|uniref:response regulator n=1 Tax=Aeromicrobium sp. YIM 150415 TaxID=2803912 RepID=UPI0019647AC5|nr:response regulator [Aeromicrobium sp. YIM 150415]MBM9462962.1 response regulator [Aeromicrobium sp. YIM 150415]
MATVLVVDDTPSIRFLIRTNLELAGHDVVEAFDGLDSLEMLSVTDPPPDAVTMDMMMPRMDGLAAVQRIRSDRRWDRLAIVMVTTQGQHYDVTAADRAGVDAYVTKPFEPDALVATIEGAIADRQAGDT